VPNGLHSGSNVVLSCFFPSSPRLLLILRFSHSHPLPPAPQFIRVIVAYVYKRMKDNGSANNTWVKFICCCLQVRPAAAAAVA
jgi:hypothetical protein